MIKPIVHKRLKKINAELIAIEKGIVQTAIRLDASLQNDSLQYIFEPLYLRELKNSEFPIFLI